ncbi:NUDIX hydrolase [Thalassovita sp.]|uniref:NUDIX hydrolase n=1 Tax=Thalassovita sp. TaxID=1979401 RepID=UPI002B26F1B0|nr:NUDIX hydrolase [Thalassovita sp.]
MIRRFGTPPESGRTYTLRHGAYAILPLGDQVLLTHQSQPYPEFQLPGGGIDPGESPLHALHREVIEETGWSISTPRRLGAFRRFTFMPDYDIWAEKLCTIYVARPVRQMHDPLEPGHSAIWMPFDLAIDALGNPGDQHFLAQL